MPEYLFFESREDAVLASTAGEVQVGSLAEIDGLEYLYTEVDAAITDMPGWLPFGDFVQPEHFGAVASSTPTDDTSPDSGPAFQAMLNWIGVDPGRMGRDLSSGYRYFSTGLSTTGNVRFDAGSARYHIGYTGGPFLRASKTHVTKPVALAADYDPDILALTLEDPGLTYGDDTDADRPPMRRGQWIRVVSDAVNPFDRAMAEDDEHRQYRVQEFAQVGLGSTAKKIVLEMPLRFAVGMNAAMNTEVPAYTVGLKARVAVLDMDTRFEFRGGYIFYDDNGQSGQGVNTLSVVGYYNPIFDGINITREFNSAIRVRGTVGALIQNCTFGPLGEVRDNDELLPRGGYGVCDGGYYTRVVNCNFSRSRHAYTTLADRQSEIASTVFGGGNTVGALVVGCYSNRAHAGAFDTHHGAVDITFVNCTAEGGGPSFSSRGVNVRAINCSSVRASRIHVITDSMGVAGGSADPDSPAERYAPTLLVDGGSHDLVSQSTIANVYTRPGTLTLRDTTIRVRRWDAIRIEGGIFNVEGNTKVVVTDFGGQYPIDNPASGIFFAGVSGSLAAPLYGKSAPDINVSGELTLDLRAFTDLSKVKNVIQNAAGAIYKQSGTLTILTSSGHVAAYYAATNSTVRCIPGSRLVLSQPADATNTSLGPGEFAGLLTISDGDGNVLRDSEGRLVGAGVGSLLHRGMLSTSDSLDDFFTNAYIGSWYQPSAAGATIENGYPVATLRGTLVVHAATSTGGFVVQEYFAQSNTPQQQGRRFTRTRYLSSGTVSPWCELVTTRGTGNINLAVASYANDAAAGAAGLVSGDVYKTSTGELRVKL